MDVLSLFLYLLVMAGTTYLVRMLPFTLFRKQIKSRYLLSFFYYIPYAVLGAMTFPAILYATGNMITAIAGAGVAVLLSLFRVPLIWTTIACCLTAFLTGLIL